MDEGNKRADYCHFTKSNKNLPISPGYPVNAIIHKNWRYTDAVNNGTSWSLYMFNNEISLMTFMCFRSQLCWESGLLHHWIKNSQPNMISVCWIITGIIESQWEITSKICLWWTFPALLLSYWLVFPCPFWRFLSKSYNRLTKRLKVEGWNGSFAIQLLIGKTVMYYDKLNIVAFLHKMRLRLININFA